VRHKRSMRATPDWLRLPPEIAQPPTHPRVAAAGHARITRTNPIDCGRFRVLRQRDCDLVAAIQPRADALREPGRFCRNLPQRRASLRRPAQISVALPRQTRRSRCASDKVAHWGQAMSEATAGLSLTGNLRRDARIVGLWFASTTSMIGSGWLAQSYCSCCGAISRTWRGASVCRRRACWRRSPSFAATGSSNGPDAGRTRCCLP
jgi:hypothetical protein